jgi:hypothetical protein
VTIAACHVASPLRVRLTAWPVTELTGLAELVDANDAVVCCMRVSGARDVVQSAVRQILWDAIGAARDAGNLEIALTPNGKPYLAGRGAELKFNLSHAGGVLVVALSRTSEVGVDVERVRAVPDWRRIAERVFDQTAREQLFAEIACGEHEDDVFIRHWCRMEAAVKATGEGVFGRDTRDAANDAAVGRARPRVIDLPDLPFPAGDSRYRAALALCP